ncbi:hypothetical protein EI94DRAFT_1607899, partial [Lactarius quietus]
GLKRPRRVLNMALCSSPSLIQMLLYPCLTSNLVNSTAPPRSCIKSDINCHGLTLCGLLIISITRSWSSGHLLYGYDYNSKPLLVMDTYASPVIGICRCFRYLYYLR